MSLRPIKVSAQTIRKAHAIHPIVDLQIEYSLISRGIEKDILPTLRELGIGLTAYGVLSRGLISGHWSKAREGDGDFRSINPRFQGENLDKNLQLVEKLREEARSKGVTVTQLAIAWVLAKGKDIVPLVGARKRDRLDERFVGQVHQVVNQKKVVTLGAICASLESPGRIRAPM